MQFIETDKTNFDWSNALERNFISLFDTQTYNLDNKLKIQKLYVSKNKHEWVLRKEKLQELKKIIPDTTATYHLRDPGP